MRFGLGRVTISQQAGGSGRENGSMDNSCNIGFFSISEEAVDRLRVRPKIILFSGDFIQYVVTELFCHVIHII